jgi:hypothetical protein
MEASALINPQFEKPRRSEDDPGGGGVGAGASRQRAEDRAAEGSDSATGVRGEG